MARLKTERNCKGAPYWHDTRRRSMTYYKRMLRILNIRGAGGRSKTPHRLKAICQISKEHPFVQFMASQRGGGLRLLFLQLISSVGLGDSPRRPRSFPWLSFARAIILMIEIETFNNKQPTRELRYQASLLPRELFSALNDTFWE